jgi:catechol 2,3-dioxygenase-like lactoylglutathione lyase family enzyme
MILPFAHIGVLVDDLDDSIQPYEQLGFTFIPPQSVHVDHLEDEDGTRKEIDLRVVFSHQGPPHLELLQATGDGIYGSRHAGGLHHLAIFADDPVARRAELVSKGFRPTAAQYRSDGSMIVTYLDPADFDGVRIELLDAAVEDTILRWVTGDTAATP